VRGPVLNERTRWWALGVLSLSAFIITVDNTILNVALPTLEREVHVSTSELQWIVDAYVLVFAGILLTAGSLGDRFGRARVLRVGLVLFAAASALAAWSSDGTTLIVCRAVMGIGGALVAPASLSIVTNVFKNPRERARAIGMYSVVAGFALGVGPIAGGVLLAGWWWGSVFLVNVPIAVVALVLGYWLVPESKNPHPSRVDPLGVVLSIVSVSALTWATIEAPSKGWGSTATLVAFAIAIALLVCFIAWELHCDHPMLELEFFRNPRFSVANVAIVTATFGYGGALFIVTQFLQLVLGYSPLGAAVRLIPLSASFMVMSVFSPRLAERFGTKAVVVLALLVFALGLLSLAALTSVSSGYVPVLLGMLGMGGGFGMAQAPTLDAVMGSVPPEKAGLGSATSGTTRQMGTAFGVAVCGSLLVSGYHAQLQERTRHLRVPPSLLSKARSSLAGALEAARELGGATSRVVGNAAREAFVHGMRIGLVVAAVVALFGALLALRALPARAREQYGADHIPALTAGDDTLSPVVVPE
jgi:EmrB/QacA subfamily drug resistance transporter